MKVSVDKNGKVEIIVGEKDYLKPKFAQFSTDNVLYLAAVVVDDLADLVDAFLVDAVRGGVGHHERGQIARVLLRRRAQLIDTDVALRVRAGHHDLHPAHRRRRRVGAVGGYL